MSQAVSKRKPRKAQAEKIERDRLYNTAEAADCLGVSKQTLERWRVQGYGPPYVRLGPPDRGLVAYRGTDLLDYIEAQVVNRATSEQAARAGF